MDESVPGQVCSGRSPGLIASLYAEWPGLCADPALVARFAKWRQECQGLAPFATPAELVEQVPGLGPEEVDRVFAALLGYATGRQSPDSDFAARVVLQLMLPKVVDLAGSLDRFEDWSERESFAVAGMYEAIRSYPLDRWPRFTPVCLARSARNLIKVPVRGSWNAACRELPVDFDVTGEDSDVAGAEDTDRLNSSEELLRLLADAVEAKVVSRIEARRLLADVGYGQNPVRAAVLGIEIDSLYKRRSRTLRKLAKWARRRRD